MILNFLSVNTRWNREKVIEFMEKYKVDCVFLDLPNSFEPYLSKRILPPVDVVYSQDIRASEPIIQFCWKRDLPIYCYLEDKISQELKKTQIDLTTLILRSKLEERIDVFEWKKLIFQDISLRETSNEFIAMKICENAGNKNACLNLSSEVENYLKEEGFEIKKIQLYDFQRPIDNLYKLASKEMKGEKIPDEIYIALIKKHIIFIDSVVELGYEDACKLLWI